MHFFCTLFHSADLPLTKKNPFSEYAIIIFDALYKEYVVNDNEKKT